MTNDRYTLEELPGVIAELRRLCDMNYQPAWDAGDPRLLERIRHKLPRLLSTLEAMRADAERFDIMCNLLESAKAGGGIEVNELLQVYEQTEPGKEVRLYWYPRTAVGFREEFGPTVREAIDAARREDGDV